MKYKIFHFVIESFYWLLLFLAPVLGSIMVGLIAIAFFDLSIDTLLYFIPFGALLGIFLAEKIRRKYGCASYWSMLYATPDISPSVMEHIENEEQEAVKKPH